MPASLFSLMPEMIHRKTVLREVWRELVHQHSTITIWQKRVAARPMWRSGRGGGEVGRRHVSTILKNINIDMVIFENSNIDIDKAILKNIDIDRKSLRNIDIDIDLSIIKISI